MYNVSLLAIYYKADCVVLEDRVQVKFQTLQTMGKFYIKFSVIHIN